MGCALQVLREAAAVLGDDDCRDGVRDIGRLQAELESFWLERVADLDNRPGAIGGAMPAHQAQAFLIGGLNRTPAQARRDITTARALAAAPGGEPALLPQVGAAFAAGQVNREQVDACAGVVAKLPAKILERVDEQTGQTVAARVDEFLATNANLYNARELTNLGKHLIAVLNPKDEAFDAEQYTKRYLRFTDLEDGMTVGKFQLDQASAAFLKAALAHFGRTSPDLQVDDQSGDDRPEGQEAIPVKDERTLAQKQADGLISALKAALASVQAGTIRREPPHVLVITTPEQLADAHARGPQDAPATFRKATGLAEASRCGPISATTLGVLSCDSIVQAIVLDPDSGAVLNLGTAQRTATKAQRRALAARDRGCVKCGAAPDRCSAHHVTYWSMRGGTDIDNLCLLCDACHTQVHLGVWQIVMKAGVPWLKPPSWHQLARDDGEPIRLTLHHAVQQAHKLAQQLKLDLDDEPDTG